MHRLPRLLIVTLGAVAALVFGVSPASAAGTQFPAGLAVWVWPLDPTPEVVRGFEPPAQQWNAGHRGVDLAGSAMAPVLAMREGVVTMAAPLAGRGVVVVDHGALRSTYEPVTASVHVGQRVDAGQVIGLLQSTHSHCSPDICLHVGLKRGDTYLDPLSVLGPREVRLKPQSGSSSARSGLSDARAPVGKPEPRDGSTSDQQPATGQPEQLRLVIVGVVAGGLSLIGWRRRWLGST